MQSIPIGDGRTVKLGRRRPDFSKPRARLRLSKYLKAPTPPPAVDYAAKASASLSRMYLNDRFGDCVIAGKAHAIGVWSANESGTPILATDDEIYAAYQGICGPGDNGCVITHVLDTLRDRGIVLGGKARRIDGYVDVDWTNQVEVQVAILLFGAVTIGVNLPAAWQGAAKVWDVTNTGIVGGHDVTLVGYDAARVTVSTWGSTRDLNLAGPDQPAVGRGSLRDAVAGLVRGRRHLPVGLRRGGPEGGPGGDPERGDPADHAAGPPGADARGRRDHPDRPGRQDHLAAEGVGDGGLRRAQRDPDRPGGQGAGVPLRPVEGVGQDGVSGAVSAAG
jgi:hypothetical protein